MAKKPVPGLQELPRDPLGLSPDRQPQTDGEMLPDDLRRAQLESPDLQADPKPVKLVQPARDGPEGEGGPPAPPVAKAAPAPRFIHQNERAPEGLRRFKIRCTNLGDQPTRYTLAADEEAARGHYLRATGIDALLACLPEEGRPAPRLSVRPLPD